MKIIVALVALLPLAEVTVEQNAIAPKHPGQMSVCKPANAAAKKTGNVVFKLYPSERKLDFIMPVAWQTLVEMRDLDPPQDPPTVILRWQPHEGELLVGEINWRDDTSEVPSMFTLRLGTRKNETVWAKWSCAAKL